MKAEQQDAAAKEELSRLRLREAASRGSLTSAKLDEAALVSFKHASTNASRAIDFSPSNTRRLISIYDVFAGYDLTDGQAQLVSQL